MVLYVDTKDLLQYVNKYIAKKGRIIFFYVLPYWYINHNHK